MWIVVEISALLIALVAFVVALEIGFRLGARRQAKSDESDKTHANALHGATLGLLALLLGFTFAMAVSRYETRKTYMVDQANAIGTVALRAKLLPSPGAEKAYALTRDYLESRFQYNAAGTDNSAVITAEARANDLENQLWALGRDAALQDPHSQPAALYLQGLNDMFDLREKRRFALNDQVPTAVVFLLFAVSLISLGLVAYSCGLNGLRRTRANITFAFLIALVLTVILDIDRPRQGFVQVSQESLIRLQQSLAPPAP